MSQLTQAMAASHSRATHPTPQFPGRAVAHIQYPRFLLLLFLLTLPLVNPWVRGDGVGYYAYVRSLLIEHKLDFTNDWRAANESFTMGRVRPDGTLDPRLYTRTGHLDNHFAVGPSMLWTPFLLPVHYAMLTLQRLGVHVRANGYSRPYLITMALATALYGFLGLLISFRLACIYAEERWALLASVGPTHQKELRKGRFSSHALAPQVPKRPMQCSPATILFVLMEYGCISCLCYIIRNQGTLPKSP